MSGFELETFWAPVSLACLPAVLQLRGDINECILHCWVAFWDSSGCLITYGPLLNRESGTFSLIESLHPAFSSALLLIIVQNIMFVVIVWGAAATNAAGQSWCGVHAG